MASSADRQVPAQPASLVQGTQLGKRRHVSAWPTCGEATISESSYSPHEHVPPGQGQDPLASAARSARRRRSRSRRYCIHNKLNVLWTLTYAEEEWSLETVKADLAVFFRMLRVLRGRRFPYLWVIEEHPGGHGLHIHIAMRGFIRKGALQEVWGRGIVQYSKRIHQAGKELASGQELAAYLAKELAGYVAKGAESAELSGKHFYDVGQGFQPEHQGEDVTGDDSTVIGHTAGRWFGGEVPARMWCSDELGDDWAGPRVLCLYWYGRSKSP